MSQLVTGEAVALDLRPAALPSRLVAAAIDASVQGAILLVLALLMVAAAPDASESAVAAVGIVSFVSVLAGYPITFETLWRGRTPGKAAMGLRVVRDDGGPIGFRQALFRGLAGLFLEKPGLTLYAGAVITSLLHKSSKRLGDLGAGTIVLQERIPTPRTKVAFMPPPLAAWAGQLDLSGLPNDLALSVRSFLSRVDELTPQAREDLGNRLVQAVSAAVTPPPPPGTPGWAYLSAVLAERRRRAEVRMAAAHGYGPAAQGTPAGPAGYGAPPGYPAPSAPGWVPPPAPWPSAGEAIAGDAPVAAPPSGFAAPG